MKIQSVFRYFLLLIVVALTVLSVRGSVAQTATQTAIYEDALASGWANWSWGSTVNFAVSNPVQSGSRSIGITHNGGWVGAYLHHEGVSLSGKTHLQFWIHGGAGGRQNVVIYAEDQSGRAPKQLYVSRYIRGGVIVANAWNGVSIPLIDLNLGSYPLTGIVFQNGTANSQGTFYIDALRLVTIGTVPTPQPTAVPTAMPTAQPTPTALPNTPPAGAVPTAIGRNVMLGLSNLPGDVNWMSQSGIPFGARYTYLTSGVNTGYGWSTWNSPAGQYATYYLNDSARLNALPVFTYYQILPSYPRSYDESLPAYVEKFASADLMRAYFTDWKLLMQKCAAFNRPVVVHVEPDLWGYLMMTKPNAASYAAKIGSSGFAEVAGLPDNIVGFAQALVRLKTRYAPKVVLALHASTWAQGTDITLNTNAQYDLKAHAERTGNWLNGLGAGWDLTFVDVADRDAAYKQIVRNQNVWWDERDLRLPNFEQVARWIGFLNKKMNRRIVLWQIPLGNTKMLSCNNTQNHYQDNRVQYFLDAAYGNRHLNRWAQAGVVAFLFGRGDTNTTTNSDAAKDGITNPAPIGGNTRRAMFADDDGGYFRERAAAYLRATVVIPGLN